MSNGSDDFFVKGEEEEQKALNQVKIWYVITSPANPTKVTLKIKAVRIKEGKVVKQVVREINNLPKVTGTSCATWDGKDKDGNFIGDWLFTAQIEAFFTDKPKEEKPVKSNLHHITELSGKHKPVIFRHKTEPFGPIYFDTVSMWGVEDTDKNVVSPASRPLEAIIDPTLNRETYYLDFLNEAWKSTVLIKPMIFSRGKVENDFVFVQYWMFYPFSTLGTNDAKNMWVYHEGDWEMMQVAVKIDKEAKKLIPEGATASQHYQGQTLSWSNIQVATKYKPIIYIAGGSHATFFALGVFAFGDCTKPHRPNAEVYALKPLGPSPVPSWWKWRGRWGALKAPPGLAIISGPLSPGYRGTAPSELIGGHHTNY